MCDYRLQNVLLRKYLPLNTIKELAGLQCSSLTEPQVAYEERIYSIEVMKFILREEYNRRITNITSLWYSTVDRDGQSASTSMAF